MKWPVEAIGVVAQVNPRLAAADRPDLDERVSFVPMAAVSGETLSIEAQAERLFSEVAKGYTPFKRGDVLVAKITPCFENGKMAMADNLAHELGFGTTEFHVFRPSERITGSYLFNLLRAPYVRKAGAMRMKGAAGQRRVPADFFAALQIPLPPLDEQKRIAGILDAADALRAKRREALGRLDTLLQSTFLDMFGDPVTNPMGWEERHLPDLVSKRKYALKRGPFGGALKKEIFVPDGFKVYEQKNVIYDDFDIGSYFIKTSDYERLVPFKVSSNNLLISCSGTIGRIAAVPLHAAPGVLNQALLKIDLDESIMLNSFFLVLWRSQSFEQQVLGMTHGTGMKNMKSMAELKGISFFVPPLNLQLRFAAIVESVEQQKANQRAHLVSCHLSA